MSDLVRVIVSNNKTSVMVETRLINHGFIIVGKNLPNKPTLSVFAIALDDYDYNNMMNILKDIKGVDGIAIYEQDHQASWC